MGIDLDEFGWTEMEGTPRPVESKLKSNKIAIIIEKHHVVVDTAVFMFAKIVINK